MHIFFLYCRDLRGCHGNTWMTQGTPYYIVLKVLHCIGIVRFQILIGLTVSAVVQDVWFRALVVCSVQSFCLEGKLIFFFLKILCVNNLEMVLEQVLAVQPA